MQKWKKVSSLLLALCLVTVLLAGCGGSEAPQESTAPATGSSTAEPAPSEELVELTLLIDKDASTEGLEAIVAVIEEKYNIKTNFEVRVGGAEGDNIIKTRLASGDITDLFWYNTGALLGAISPADYCLDLTDEPFAANFNKDFLEAASVDGRLYAIPRGSAEAGGILYNKKVYDELGLEVPHTWEDFLANCQAVQDAGKVGVIGAYKDDWTSQLIFLGDEYNVVQANPNFPQEFTENKAKYASSPEALRSWQKLADCQPYLNEDFLATTHDVALDMLATGEGAHYPMLTGSLSSIDANYPDEANNIGFFGVPGDDASAHGMTLWMPVGVYANKNSDKIDAIKTWMEFYVSQEAIDISSAVLKPTGPYVINGMNLPEDSYEGVKDMQNYMEAGNTAMALEYASPVKGTNAPQICVSVGSGIITPEDGAEQYDADVAKQAVQLNLEGWN